MTDETSAASSKVSEKMDEAEMTASAVPTRFPAKEREKRDRPAARRRPSRRDPAISRT